MFAPAASDRDGLSARRGPNRPIIPNPRFSVKEKLVFFCALAIVGALPGFLLPLSNPDLFWHLSAGDWILAHRALPRVDFLSYSRQGQPWQDFEWLAQAAFAVVYARAGLLGLWLLKIGFLVGSWLLVDRALAANGVAALGRVAGLSLFSALVLGYSDIRPELFSLIFFCALLWRLESWRLAGPRRPWLELAGLAAGFALWADAHAGFFFGWALIGCYGLAEALLRRWRRAGQAAAALVVAGLATLANPYGLGPHRVAWQHWRLGGTLSGLIAEWHPMSAENPLHWPFWAAAALAAFLLVLRFLDEKPEPFPAGCALAAGFFGLEALAHQRMALFFAAPAVLLIVLLARGRGWLKPRPVAALLAGCLGFSLWLTPRVRWGTFNDKFVARRAAGFLDAQRTALESLRFYEPSEWGGFLGWRLPWFKVYNDGRYLFHQEMAAVQDAARDDARWAAFLEAKGFSGALLPNMNLRLLARPWYVYYMPRQRWALVYWDDQALVFVDRRAAPPAWLLAHEYRYVRPKDDEAFSEARRRGEIPEDAVRAELTRHAAELTGTYP